MKKAIGALLISWPILTIAGIAMHQIGLPMTLAIFGGVGLVGVTTILGAHLIDNS